MDQKTKCSVGIVAKFGSRNVLETAGLVVVKPR
jgi:hypothetical protein